MQKKKEDIVTSLWLSIRVQEKYQKPFTNHFVGLYLKY
jgi:hypothetical protein